MEDQVQALEAFYKNYDPQNVPDKATLDGLAKQYAGKEKDLWTDLYGHYDPKNQPKDDDLNYLSSLSNPYGAEKKNGAGSGDSLQPLETGSGGIQTEADSPAEPPLAEDLGRIWDRFKQVGNETRVAAQQATIERIESQPLSKRMADYYLNSVSPGALKRVEEGRWGGDDLDVKALWDKVNSNSPEAAQIEAELQKIYKTVDPNDKRSVENAAIDAKQVMLSRMNPKTARKSWDDLASTIANFEDYDPQGYHQRLNRQIVDRYKETGMDEREAYRNLMGATLDEGIMDEERTKEALLGYEVMNWKDAVVKAVRKGDGAMVDFAGKKLEEAERAEAGLKNQRLAELDTDISELKGQLAMDSPPEYRSEIREKIKAAEAARAGFINPDARIKAAYAKYGDAAKQSMPDGTPMEQLRRLYAEIAWDRKQVAKRIWAAEGGDGPVEYALKNMANSFGGGGHNDDHRRLVQLEAQLKDLAPIVFLNESPALSDDKAGFGTSAWNGLLNTIGGKGSPMSGTSRQEDALALARNLQIAGVTPEVLNDPSMAGIADRTKEPGLRDAEYWGNLLGTSGGLMFHIMMAQQGTGALGMGGAISKLIGAEKYGGAILPLLGDAVESGLNYKLAGMASVDNQDELSFMGGFFGGAAGSLGKNGFDGAKKAVAGVFGDKAGEAARVITDFGAQRLGSGIGESFEETGQQLVQMWNQSNTGQEFWDKFGKQFGDVPDLVKFYVSTMAMGMFMGGAHSDGLGKYMREYASDQLEGMPPAERRIAEDLTAQIEAESHDLIEGAQGGGGEDETRQEAPAMELTPEATAAQAELQRRREIDQQMIDQGLGDRINTAQTQEERIREERESLLAQQGRQELTDAEKKRLADLETIVTGLDQMRDQTAFREVAPAPEVSTETETSETQEGDVENVTPSNTIEIDGQKIELPTIEGLNPPQTPVSETVPPATEPVAPTDESIIDVTGQSEAIPPETPKRRDQEIADQINEFFNGLAGAIGENSAAKIREYAERILAGESRESVTQGQTDKAIALIDQAVELQRGLQQETTVEQPVVESPAPKPLEVGEEINYMGGPKGSETKRSGKVLEVLPNGDYRVEINVGGEMVPTVVKKDKVVLETPAAPAVEETTTETVTPQTPAEAQVGGETTQQQTIPPVAPQTQQAAPAIDLERIVDAGLQVAENLAAADLYTRENWMRMMQQYGPGVAPQLDRTWNLVSRAIPEGTVVRDGKQRVEKKGERGAYATLDRYEETNPDAVTRATQEADRSYQRMNLGEVFADAAAEIKRLGGFIAAYPSMIKSAKIPSTKVLPRLQAMRALSIRFYGDLLDRMAVEMETATDEQKAELEGIMQDAKDRLDHLLDAWAELGTTGGQIGATNAGWRMLMENEAGYVATAIREYNNEQVNGEKKKQRDRKKKIKETTEGLNGDRTEIGEEVANSELSGQVADAVAEEKAKPKEKPKEQNKKKGLGKTKDQIAEIKRKALEDMRKAGRAGFAGSFGSPAALDFLDAAARYGYALVAEGVITFKEWSARMKADIPELTEEQISAAWSHDVDGKPVSDHARGELEERAKPKKRTAEQKKSLRGKIREAISDHFNYSGAEKAQKRAERIISDAQKSGKDMDAAKARAQKVLDRAGMTLQERLMDTADLTAEEAQYVYEAVRDEFDAKAKARVEARAKALRKKPKGNRKPSKSDTQRAIEAMVDGELTDQHVADIFADRLGLIAPMTAEEMAKMRALGRALAQTPPGSDLQRKAAIALERYTSQFMPGQGAVKEHLDIWKSLVYAAVLSGVPTHVKNILSSASMISLTFAEAFTNISKWSRAMRAAWKAGDGEKMRTLARANPVTEMLVKTEAMLKSLPKGFDAFMSVMRSGFLDSKYLESKGGKLGRLASPLERRTFRGGKFNPYNYFKYVGRLLSAEDAFMFTIAHEMELADAVRRQRLSTAPGSIIAEARKSLAENSQEWQDAMTQAEQDVDNVAGTIGLAGKARETAIRMRAREILHDQLGLDEQAMQDTEDIARSKIFTLKRNGMWGKMATGMKMLNNSKVGAFTWPFIMFTDIIGNLGDTMGDFNPFRGIARANGLSLTGIIQSLGGSETSARMSSNRSEQMYYEQMGRAWMGKAFFLAVMAMMFGGDDDDRWIDFTGKNHPTHPNFIMIGGKPIVSWNLFPWMIPTLAFATRLDEQIKKNPNMSEDDLMGWAERVTLGLLAAETGVGGMSVAESANSLLEFGSVVATALADGELDGKKLENLAMKFSKDVLGVMTKPLPQRVTFVEQAAQLIDPTAYSKKDIAQVLMYSITGAFYRNETIGAVSQIDLFGNEIKRGIGSDTFDYISNYLKDEKTRKRFEFLYDHGVTFGPLQNRELFFKGDGTENEKDKMTPTQFKKYAELSGKAFASALDAYMDNRSLPPYIRVPEGSTWETDYKTPQEKDKGKTMLEKKVKSMMEKARENAKKEMDKIPVKDGGFGGKRL